MHNSFYAKRCLVITAALCVLVILFFCVQALMQSAVSVTLLHDKNSRYVTGEPLVLSDRLEDRAVYLDLVPHNFEVVRVENKSRQYTLFEMYYPQRFTGSRSQLKEDKKEEAAMSIMYNTSSQPRGNILVIRADLAPGEHVVRARVTWRRYGLKLTSHSNDIIIHVEEPTHEEHKALVQLPAEAWLGGRDRSNWDSFKNQKEQGDLREYIVSHSDSRFRQYALLRLSLVSPLFADLRGSSEHVEELKMLAGMPDTNSLIKEYAEMRLEVWRKHWNIWGGGVKADGGNSLAK